MLTTEATAVAMDGLAAGSGGAGSVFHGRFGDGVTLSLDLAVVTEHGRTGPGLKEGSTQEDALRYLRKNGVPLGTCNWNQYFRILQVKAVLRQNLYLCTSESIKKNRGNCTCNCTCDLLHLEGRYF